MLWQALLYASGAFLPCHGERQFSAIPSFSVAHKSSSKQGASLRDACSLKTSCSGPSHQTADLFLRQAWLANLLPVLHTKRLGSQTFL